ncbi:murein L,D-transpeptidase family protein [Pedobacter heparinus]|uniref:L,D-transpeptidase family protein n=1 Tax=Pedobacter heparinus TaxID=984 RepID=UPI00292E6DC7|nr:L,D-transpeptidase family protein [Pedobacter heparinus]
MKVLVKLIFLLTMTTPAFAQADFKTEQLKFDRVSAAYEEKWNSLQEALRSAGIGRPFKLYMAAYKAEGKLELWLKTNGQKTHQLFRTYNFCAQSGILGPKVKEGDLQTPEGYYYLNVFNPKSSFHLSLGISYPNQVDRFRSGKEKPGGEIYIHGNCVTVGCIPLTDDKIREVYVLAVEAKNAGQDQIPVHIFPFKMTAGNLNTYLKQFPAHRAFWTNLQTGYAYFEKNHMIPVLSEKSGRYLFK